MFELVGKWKLAKKEGFGEFLKYTQVPWYQRKIAQYSNIFTDIIKNDDGTFTKTVQSTFYNADPEVIDFNNNKEIITGTLKKKYSYLNNYISCQVIGSIVSWNEKIYYQEPNMIVEYTWPSGKCKQYFSKN